MILRHYWPLVPPELRHLVYPEQGHILWKGKVQDRVGYLEPVHYVRRGRPRQVARMLWQYATGVRMRPTHILQRRCQDSRCVSPLHRARMHRMPTRSGLTVAQRLRRRGEGVETYQERAPDARARRPAERLGEPVPRDGDEWGDVRPATRSECLKARRPCPWVSCRFHLLTEAKGTEEEVAERIVAADRTCALDVVDEAPDGAACDDIAKMFDLTRERIRQIERTALHRAQRALEQIEGDGRE